MTENKSVIRYVATRLNADGDRVLAVAAQGRNTYATEQEAQAWIDAVKSNNNADSIAFLRAETLEVRPCECWPGHFDPKGIYFDVDKKYRVEVIADSSGTFVGNSLEFNSPAEAVTYAKDLAWRWTAVRRWRVMKGETLVTEGV